MSCPSRARLAAAGAGEDITAELHAETCPRCGAELEAMAAVVRVARAAPAPALSADRRARIAALAMATADAEPTAPRRRAPQRSWIGALAVAAIAAAVALAAFPRHDRPAPPVTGAIAAAPSAVAPSATPPAPAHAADEPRAGTPAPRVTAAAPGSDAAASHPSVTIASIAPTGAPKPRRSDAASGSAAIAAPPHHSVTAVAPSPLTERPPVAPPHDGTATFDARTTAPVQVVAGDTSLRIAGAKAEVTAHGGAVTMVRVFAGSVDVMYAGTRQIVETGEIWVRPDAPPGDAAAVSLHAFEQGWIALREARDRDAVAAFERAVAPVVAEDAAYWAAVASERSGDRSGAARRLHGFLARFPASVRAGDARRALARLER